MKIISINTILITGKPLRCYLTSADQFTELKQDMVLTGQTQELYANYAIERYWVHYFADKVAELGTGNKCVQCRPVVYLWLRLQLVTKGPGGSSVQSETTRQTTRQVYQLVLSVAIFEFAPNRVVSPNEPAFTPLKSPL